MSDWKTVPLGELLQLQRGHDLPSQDRIEGSIPIVGSFGITGWHNEAKYDGPGVAIGRSGASIGQATLIQEPYWPLNTCLFVSDFKGNDPRWVYHLMDSIDFNAFNSGSAQPSLNRNFLRNIPVEAPPVLEQQAIAEVLGALDEKIAANTKLIDTLEGHMSLELSATVARDSSCIALDDIAEFHNRRRIPLSSRERDERPGSIPYYGASGVFGTVDVPIFDEHLVLVGEDGSVINGDGTPVVQYIWGPAWVNNHAHVLTGKSISTELLYYAIAREQVATLVTGAVQPKINMGNLRRLELRIPSTSMLPRIESLIGSETAVKRAIVEETQTLAATRDALLPQLMSGKLRVKEAEALVSAAI